MGRKRPDHRVDILVGVILSSLRKEQDKGALVSGPFGPACIVALDGSFPLRNIAINALHQLDLSFPTRV